VVNQPRRLDDRSCLFPIFVCHQVNLNSSNWILIKFSVFERGRHD